MPLRQIQTICAIKGKFVSAAALKLPALKSAGNGWAISNLAAPVSHIWYFKGIPSRMGLILDISPRLLEESTCILQLILLPIQARHRTGAKGQLLTEKEYR